MTDSFAPSAPASSGPSDHQAALDPALAGPEAAVEGFRRRFEAVSGEMARVLVGQDAIVAGTLMCLFAGGHVLLEGVPGLGKTLLVRTLAGTLGLDFNRIQFTPDLMPSDVTGTNILSENAEGRREFRFERGPLFTNVLLADEINRATPKTQSALLEAMQEASVSVAGTTHRLADPYMVLATQNPLEQEGTYPLPEAQLDRFLFKLKVYYPTFPEMMEIVTRTTTGQNAEPRPILASDEVLLMRALVRAVAIAPHVQEHAVRLVLATQPGDPNAPERVRSFVRYGASPRGAQALILCAKARALSQGRFHVASEDLELVTLPSLRHRIILGYEGLAEGIDIDDLIGDVVDHVATTVGVHPS